MVKPHPSFILIALVGILTYHFLLSAKEGNYDKSLPLSCAVFAVKIWTAYHHASILEG
ncbi:uncharacterized protein PHALS_04114 [Plasmopara halstedii]|uniref:Uncharacterized protein n=1 Tax=Plasmopara halstedii TaxID=4781 RepID=A0A0P1A852_PLAHL|nr:uncharacterized protein PHALS_04114 [Plasmopara halstedii]CEG36861.1 hypothetical protein PHALS_04114 [Plasmopara halstedii]|eukprot:XP_024573230.1 hypothetical protein PHALS_04114 [Plasmopara halstedii]